jgi:hypothetical protein
MRSTQKDMTHPFHLLRGRRKSTTPIARMGVDWASYFDSSRYVMSPQEGQAPHPVPASISGVEGH